MTGVIEDNMENYGGIYLMAVSGAKGNIAQIKQMAGMRGLMASSKGHIIDRPIKSSFREGLSVLEYFISTHGSRKGLSDTALRTADSGYLTRRLIDVAQEVTITIDDCGAATGFWMENEPDDPLATPFADRLKSRTLAQPIADPGTGEIIADAGQAVDEALAGVVASAGVDGALVRSPLACEAERGLCKSCYGDSLATGATVMQGEAVGIIAAQSIGEPGTQLTMRTFHTGGIAGEDITSGLPRVVELFEARSPKGEAVLSEIDGIASIVEETDAEGRIARRSVVIDSVEEYSDEYRLPEGHVPLFKDGDTVNIGDPLAEAGEEQDQEGESVAVQVAELTARVAGTASVSDGSMTISWEEKDEREYAVSAAATITVKDGDRVTAGDALTAGPKSPPADTQDSRQGGRPAIPDRGGAEGLPLPGCHHPRQAHRGRRAPDDAQGEHRLPRRHRPPARRVRGQGGVRGDQRLGAGGGRRARHGQSGAPRHHQGVPQHGQLPGRRLLPGDDEGADRVGNQRRSRQPARAEGERHNRQAHPRAV